VSAARAARAAARAAVLRGNAQDGEIPGQLAWPGLVAVLPVRVGDPVTSQTGAEDIKVRRGSQQHRLLVVYGNHPTGLTADEAVAQTTISVRSCYWKRVSELLAAGLLEDTGRTRMGDQGSLQRVNRITDAGFALLRTLP
jgi:hypothetical protein